MFTEINDKMYLADPLDQKAIKHLYSPKGPSDKTIALRIWAILLAMSIGGIAVGAVIEAIGLAAGSGILCLVLIVGAAVIAGSPPSANRPLHKSFRKLVEQDTILELPPDFLEAIDQLLAKHGIKEYAKATYQPSATDFTAIRAAVWEFRRGLASSEYWEEHLVPELLQGVIDRIKAAQREEQLQRIEERTQVTQFDPTNLLDS